MTWFAVIVLLLVGEIGWAIFLTVLLVLVGR